MRCDKKLQVPLRLVPLLFLMLAVRLCGIPMTDGERNSSEHQDNVESVEQTTEQNRRAEEEDDDNQIKLSQHVMENNVSSLMSDSISLSSSQLHELREAAENASSSDAASESSSKGSMQGVVVKFVPPTEADLQNEIANRTDRASWKDVGEEPPNLILASPNQNKKPLHFKVSNQKEIFSNNCLKEMALLKKRDSKLAPLVDDWTTAFQQAQEATTPEEGKELLAHKKGILDAITQHVPAYDNPDRRTKFQDQLNIVQAHENAITQLDAALGTDIPFRKREAQAVQSLITTARARDQASEKKSLQQSALKAGLLKQIATPQGSIEKYIEEHSEIINALAETEPSLKPLVTKWNSTAERAQKSFSMNKDSAEEQARHEDALVALHGTFALIEKQALRSPQREQLEPLLSASKHFDRAEEIVQQANQTRGDLVMWTKAQILTPSVVQDVQVAIESKGKTIHDLAAAAQNISKLSNMIIDYRARVAETTATAENKTNLNEAIVFAEAAIKNYSDFALAVETEKPPEVYLPYSYRGRMNDAQAMAREYGFRAQQAIIPADNLNESDAWKRAIDVKIKEAEQLREGLDAPNQAEACNKIAIEYHQSATAYELSALSYQASARSSQNGDKELSTLQKNLGIYQQILGMAYTNTARWEATGNPEKAALYRKAIPFCQESISCGQGALTSFQQGERELSTLKKNLGDSQQNLGATYLNAAGQETAGNPKKAELHRKAIPFYQETISLRQEALKSFQQGERELSTLQTNLGNSQINLGTTYLGAALQEADENPKKAGLFRKAIPCYQEAISLRQEALKSFQQGEKELSTLQTNLSNAQNRLGNAFHYAALQEAAANRKKAELYGEAIPFYQEAVSFGQGALKSFQDGDLQLAASQQNLAQKQIDLGDALVEAARAFK